MAMIVGPSKAKTLLPALLERVGRARRLPSPSTAGPEPNSGPSRPSRSRMFPKPSRR